MLWRITFTKTEVLLPRPAHIATMSPLFRWTGVRPSTIARQGLRIVLMKMPRSVVVVVGFICIWNRCQNILFNVLDRGGYPVKTFRQGWIPCRGDFCRGAGCGGQPCASGVISAFFNTPTLNDIFGPKKSHLPALEFRSGRFLGFHTQIFSQICWGEIALFENSVFLPYKIRRPKR